MLDLEKIVDIEFDGINHSDYPDYCNAYISRAFIGYPSGGARELNEEELDWLNEQREFVYEKLWDWLY